MTLEDAMRAACDEAGVKPPRGLPTFGRWKRLDTLGQNGRGDASIILFDQAGGMVWNWQTAQKVPFRAGADSVRSLSTKELQRIKREAEARRRRDAEEAASAASVACRIVKSAKVETHPYLEGKGFPEEHGLVHDNPASFFPASELGVAMARAFPKEGGPWLIVPGRIGKDVATVQFIACDGFKKNLFRGRMNGASHRIASGRETWVCEGIATALSVRAALRLLGRSATILCAFSASNAASIAKSIPGAVLATDHDKPVENFGGLGTGEYYARESGRAWAMPPERGDWNDYHQAHDLRAVALLLREVRG